MIYIYKPQESWTMPTKSRLQLHEIFIDIPGPFLANQRVDVFRWIIINQVLRFIHDLLLLESAWATSKLLDLYIFFSSKQLQRQQQQQQQQQQPKKKSFQIFSVLLSQLLTFIKGIGLFGAGCFQIFCILLIRGLFRLRLFQVAWLVTKVTKPWSSSWLNQPIWTICNRQIGSFKGVKIQKICETDQPVIAFLKKMEVCTNTCFGDIPNSSRKRDCLQSTKRIWLK